MRKRISMAAVVLVLLAIAVPGRAGPECVSYQVAVLKLTTQGKPCLVNAPPPFTQRFVWSACQGVPPASFSMCVGLDVYTP